MLLCRVQVVGVCSSAGCRWSVCAPLPGAGGRCVLLCRVQVVGVCSSAGCRWSVCAPLPGAGGRCVLLCRVQVVGVCSSAGCRWSVYAPNIFYRELVEAHGYSRFRMANCEL